jgi:hypothetical protein
LVALTPRVLRRRMPRPTDNREMPNFLIIGAAKCGTSSLHAYLDLHPEIAMSKLKEPKYFVREVSPEFLRDFPEFEGFHTTARDAYLGLFEPGHRFRGEASTAYSNSPQFPGVPAAIHSEIPDAKLIYLVRDPVERVISQYVQWLGSANRYRRDLVRRYGIEGLMSDPHDPSINIISNSLYMRQLDEYLRFFPRESLLLIDSADLESDRRQTLSRIFSFIGADPDFWDDGMLERVNEGARKREVGSLYMKLRESTLARGTLDLLPEERRALLVDVGYRILSRPVERPSIDPVLKEKIERTVSEDVAELRRFTGMDFPTWSV